MTEKPTITISLPIYGRYERTLRAIESIMNQKTEYSLELLVTNDGDPRFNTPLFLNVMAHVNTTLHSIGHKFCYENNLEHTGSWGYRIRNQHIHDAKGTFFMFMGNDDELLPNHLEDKLKYIAKTIYDWIYYDSWVEPYDAPRNAQLQPGMIGHSEIIVKTSFLQKMPPHTDQYGHDWTLIQNMMNKSVGYIKAVGAPQTYIVKSVPGNEEKGID